MKSILEGWTLLRSFVCAHCLAKFETSGECWQHVFAKHMPGAASK